MRVTHLRQRVTISRTGLDSGETELHFGIVAGVIVLISIKATVPLTRPSMLGVSVAKSSMWTIRWKSANDGWYRDNVVLDGQLGIL
jgi:hypothetical protein